MSGSVFVCVLSVCVCVCVCVGVCVCVCFLPVESLKQVFGVDSKSLFILVSSLSRIMKTQNYTHMTYRVCDSSDEGRLSVSIVSLLHNLLELRLPVEVDEINKIKCVDMNHTTVVCVV